MTLDEMIAVLQAAKDGKPIQYLPLFGPDAGAWQNASTPFWDFRSYSYRVKPELRECWVLLFKSGVLGTAYESKAKAIAYSGEIDRIIHFREVLE